MSGRKIGVINALHIPHPKNPAVSYANCQVELCLVTLDVATLSMETRLSNKRFIESLGFVGSRASSDLSSPREVQPG